MSESGLSELERLAEEMRDESKQRRRRRNGNGGPAIYRRQASPWRWRVCLSNCIACSRAR